ncbi:hypothetical protein LCGC14_0259140 [marine sediment metagenome]|uniref:Uncharacterized protein n=1 Tax=marine sediment metagenome TaxID=412755 RepID=A0A0F9U779_9ZZZZ
MKKPRPPRPGQVYWNERNKSMATIYEVSDGMIRATVSQVDDQARPRIKPPRRFFSIAWRQGVPEHCTLQYDPPKRNGE